MILILLPSFYHFSFSDDSENNERTCTIRHLKSNNQSHNRQHNYHNLNTTNEDDPLNYVIPIYSDTSGEKIKELISHQYDSF